MKKMRIFKSMLTALAAIILSAFIIINYKAPAFAGESETPKHEIDIFVEKAMDKDPSTAGMIAATEEGEKKWDAELNKYYKLLMGAVDKESQAALKKAQLAWITFRDAEFEMIATLYSKKEGTMYRVIAAGARMEVVKKRALDLKLLYDEHFANN
ncbi:MAG TPA: DUF1311 domain-containing protein [Candidatus Wallbacteria bacterium]|nr:DUF1311 domain-containing protein [Candidatus Wallbacteria bacterium]